MSESAKSGKHRRHPPANREKQPHRVRLPGFVTGEEVGLGDVIKKATTYVGIKPCGDCERRAAILNRWLTF